MVKAENSRQSFELAHILEQFGEQYCNQYHPCLQQRKALKAITSCRTHAIGGHSSRCNECGFETQAYNSCRNKHCPKCQYIKQEKWVDKLKGRMLPVRHFHFVFTIPKALHTLFYINQKNCYNILFTAAWTAVSKASVNPRFVGAHTGAVAVLHTWTQTLNYHPHIHLVVPAGGLSEDQVEWIRSGNKFFIPIKVVSKIFRGVICRQLENSINSGEIALPQDRSWQQLKAQLYAKNWIIYAQKPMGGVNSVIKYLGRYTHRVAITNSRIADVKTAEVSFRYKDNKDHGIKKIMTLSSIEFIRRFMQHILPDNFYKIRYYGILASVHARTLKEQSLSLIGKMISLSLFEGLSDAEVYRKISGKDNMKCPVCKSGIMTIFLAIPIPDR